MNRARREISPPAMDRVIEAQGRETGFDLCDGMAICTIYVNIISCMICALEDCIFELRILS